MFTGTLASGVVYAGTVAATNVVAGSLYGFTITGSSLVLNQNGVVTSIDSAYDSQAGSYYGVKVKNSNTNYRVVMTSNGLWMMDASNVVRATDF